MHMIDLAFLTGTGFIGGVLVPEFPPGRAHYARGQLHACQPPTVATHTPAPNVAGLGSCGRDVPAAAA